MSLSEKEVEAVLKGERIIGDFFPYMYVKEAIDGAKGDLKEEDNAFYDDNVRDRDLDKEEVVEVCFECFKKRINKIFEKRFGDLKWN